MRFVSESITPAPGGFDPRRMAAGLASLPSGFIWRGKPYEIVECLEHTKLSSREGGKAAGELYLRRQRFTVKLDTGQIAVIDFHRSRPGGVSSRGSRERWTLYTISADAGAG